MKKHFAILIALLITSNFVMAQSVSELDKKNGFQKFKLGSDISAVKDKIQIEPYHDKNPKIKAFNYSGNDIEQVFSVPVSDIQLTYYENKLMSIQISLSDLNDSYSDEEYARVTYSLEQIFGTDTYKPTDDGGIILKGEIWDGKEVRLENYQIYSEDLKKEGFEEKQGYIQVFSKKMLQKRINDEF